MPLKDSAAGRHTCWRFFYAAGFRPGGGHVRKSGRRCPACAHLAPAPPCGLPCAHLDPAPRQPCAHLDPDRPAPCPIHDTCKNPTRSRKTPGARHGNHVPYPASRDIPGRCLACNHLLPPLFMQTCTHPFIKQLPLYALRQDVTRAELFGTPWACPCSGVRTGTDF